jgi:hypothetical protein
MSALDDMHANLLAILGGGKAGSKTDWAASYLAALPLRDALALTRVWLAPAGYAVVPARLVQELADDLAAHIAAHYGNSTGYPSMDRKRAADMEIVTQARAMLAAAKETQA